MDRVTELRDMDGLPFTPEARLPLPHLLGKWTDADLVDFDLQGSRFVLTDKGRAAA